MRLIRILSRRRKFFLHFYILLHNNIVIYKCSKLVKLYHLKNAHSFDKKTRQAMAGWWSTRMRYSLARSASIFASEIDPMRLIMGSPSAKSITVDGKLCGISPAVTKMLTCEMKFFWIIAGDEAPFFRSRFALETSRGRSNSLKRRKSHGSDGTRTPILPPDFVRCLRSGWFPRSAKIESSIRRATMPWRVLLPSKEYESPRF